MSDTIPPKTLDTEYANTVTALTRAVRSADMTHEKVGGSSQHYVVDCLLPSLADEGLVVLPAAKVTVVSGDDGTAALREQVDELTASIESIATEAGIEDKAPLHVEMHIKAALANAAATIATLTAERDENYRRGMLDHARNVILEADVERLTKFVVEIRKIAASGDVGQNLDDALATVADYAKKADEVEG